MPNPIEDAVREFERAKPRYELFTKKVHALVDELLRAHGLDVHLTESRTKSIIGFREKITRPGKSYSDPMATMPDLGGLRIIVYYVDQVVAVCSIIEENFHVLEKNVTHRIEKFEADRFGYISDHYVLKLSKERAELTEWKAYQDMHLEVQIRTVLQHGWAAVSHALQYKRESDVPLKLQRQLFRLAGLFELADEQFMAIRDARTDIQARAKSSIEEGEIDLTLDSATLTEFAKQWHRADEIRKAATDCGFIVDAQFEPEIIGNVVRHSNRLGIGTISKLETVLLFDPHKYFSLLTKFDGGIWRADLIFLIYLMLIKSHSQDYELKMLRDDGLVEARAGVVLRAAKS